MIESSAQLVIQIGWNRGEKKDWENYGTLKKPVWYIHQTTETICNDGI